MANKGDDYLHGDELDLLFETLDYEEFDDDLNLQHEFADAVEEVSKLGLIWYPVRMAVGLVGLS